MAIPATAFVSLVSAAVRIFNAGDQALAQKARDKARKIPGATFTPSPPPTTTRGDIDDQFGADNEPLTAFAEYVVSVPKLRALLDRYLTDDDAFEQLRAVHDDFMLVGIGPGAEERLVEAAEAKIGNWLDDDGPISPEVGFALSFADVVAEVVGANPALVVRNPRIGNLVGAFAGGVGRLIPNDTTRFGDRMMLGDRLLTVVFRAALETVAREKDDIFRDDDVATIVNAAIEPILAALPEDADWNATEAVRIADVAESVLAPATKAMLATIAAQPKAFLGRGFAESKLPGALAKDLFAFASEQGPRGLLQSENLVSLYKTMLGTIAARPELVIRGGDPRNAFFKTLLSNVAETIQENPLKVDADLGVALVETSLNAFAAHSNRVLGLDDGEWETLAGDAFAKLATGLAAGLKTSDAAASPLAVLERSFLRSQVVELARLFFERAAANPEMIAGDRKEFEGIVAAVGRAIAADERLLLSGDDWLEIIAVALEEASRSPGRLFGFDADSDGGALGEQIIRTLLSEASARTGARAAGRANGGLLFGETLKFAAVTALRIAASNPAGAARALAPVGEAEPALRVLIREIDRAVDIKEKPTDGGAQMFKMGAKEWLRIFKALAPEVLIANVAPRLMDGEALSADGAARIRAALGADP